MKKTLFAVLIIFAFILIFTACDTPDPPEESTPLVSDISEAESMPENSLPEESIPDTSAPETSKPETSAPETSEPETSEPEVSEPEISEPVIDLPDLNDEKYLSDTETLLVYDSYKDIFALIEAKDYEAAYDELTSRPYEPYAQELLDAFGVSYETEYFIAYENLHWGFGDRHTFVRIFTPDNRILETKLRIDNINYYSERPFEVQETFSYNEKGQLLSSGFYTYTYDENGIMTEKSDANGYVYKYDHNAHGLVIREERYKNGELLNVCEYAYNKYGRVALCINNSNSYTSYEYNERGNPTRITRVDKDGTDHITEYVYDSAGRLITETKTEPGYITTETYVFTDDGKLLTYTKTFTDDKGNPVYETGNIVEKEEYTYNGNITEFRVYSVNGCYLIVSHSNENGQTVKAESWNIDSNGNKISPYPTVREYTYNDNGDLFEETVYVNAKAAYYRYERKHISYYPERR